ncbi:hypothetical protein DSC45_06865 [Streptomyces sp. YIM 130001]|uniref:PD-(D/E)XK motif protein n=1 Tax=Streptomyces sp. YIM 130001 TaxID=2259644 RepID=UPI000EC820C2|nr:PD-(D/E)XK motif protein [Streptomyces sp. YIM 130001]RII19715.1 hypothetical protein DSC45_06865 [Streptomyces sp. YIM 130001]
MTEGRGVSWTDVEHYLSKGQATDFPLSDASASPRVSYVVRHGGSDIALHVDLGPRDRLPQSPLSTVRVEQIADGRRRMARICTTRPELLRDFHDFVSAIADRIVGHGRTLDRAFAETVRAWSALLDRPRALAAEKRIGLLGELTALNALAAHDGWYAAVDSWTGPTGEEHDFGLPGFDLEVKTTASERRRHSVHGLHQLDPTPGRPLWLASLQLTRGGTGGRTLAESAQAVRTAVREHAPAALDRLDHTLATAGWSEDLPDDERWTLRTAPLLLTSSALPRLNFSALSGEAHERISAVQYVMDLTGIEPSPDSPAEPAEFRIP